MKRFIIVVNVAISKINSRKKHKHEKNEIYWHEYFFFSKLKCDFSLLAKLN